MKPPNHTELTDASIEEYQSSMAATGLQPHTCRAYVTNLRTLLRWSGQPAINHDELEEQAMRWLTAAVGQKSSSTIHQRRSSVMSYARWAQVGGRDFMAYYRAPKKKPADPHPLPEGMAGVDLLLGVCADLDELCLVALCGLMGLRVNEAVTTPASAVDISRPGQYVLHVVDYAGKGRRPRDLPIYDRPLGYIMARAAQEGFSREPLVRMDRDQARRRIKLLGRRAGLSREISSHDLRATFATDMYERTKDMLAVKEWLGHSNIETTVGYCGLSMSKMRAAVA